MDVSSLVPAGLQSGLDLCVVTPGYNKFSENLRKHTPVAIQCAIFCGGSRCKYENPKAWRPVHMAIQDIFSHWVTDDVLAMARPSTAQLIKKNVIEQFKGWSIKTIINLQTPGEHASCGGNLEDSGFTYEPNHFMKNGIYYYNFALKDYGEATMTKLLDMVKVVAFGVQEGRVAIHCHAGLGRTGVLIACYLIYSLRVRASDAIRFVRMKRPGAIQTRGQIQCIQEFEHFILPQMIVFPMVSNLVNRRAVSLQSYLRRQTNALHGHEQRTFKHIPKIIFVICEKILKLCDCQDDNSPADIKFRSGNIPFTRKFIANVLDRLQLKEGNLTHSYSWAESLSDSSLDFSATSKMGTDSNSSRDTSEDIRRLEDVFCASPDSPSCSTSYPVLDDNFVDEVLGDGITGQALYENDCYKEIQSQFNLKVAAQKDFFHVVNVDEAIKALLCDHETLPDETKRKLHRYQVDLNNKYSTWQRLDLETDLRILTGLLYEWLETLKRPVLDVDALSQIVIRGSRPRHCLQKLDSSNRYLLEYLLRFVSRLRPLAMDIQALIVKRITASLTHQSVWIRNTLMPSGKDFQKLRNGTAGKLNDFFTLLMSLIEEINTQDLDQSWSRSRWEVVNRLRELDVAQSE